MRIKQNQSNQDILFLDVELKKPNTAVIYGSEQGKKYTDSIEKQGLLPKTRLYVHLSEQKQTAWEVGKRHGIPIVYRIDSKKMQEDGFVFYRSVNGVWLTKQVPVKYLEREN